MEIKTENGKVYISVPKCGEPKEWFPNFKEFKDSVVEALEIYLARYNFLSLDIEAASYNEKLDILNIYAKGNTFVYKLKDIRIIKNFFCKNPITDKQYLINVATRVVLEYMIENPWLFDKYYIKNDASGALTIFKMVNAMFR